MVENTAFTAASTPALDMDVRAATRAASSALFMQVLLWRLVGAAYHATERRRPWHLWWRIGVHSVMDRNACLHHGRHHRVSGCDGPALRSGATVSG